MSQTTLFGINQSLRSTVISRRRDFEALFDGFFKLTAISYVVSPDLLLEFFEKRGYKEVEVLVGENLSEQYRQGLNQKKREVTEQLAEKVESGALRIYIPNRTIHTKLYILDGADITRVILSSANLTETAREATRQVNYAWYADLASVDPWLSQVLIDYKSHCRDCSLFMGDLKELFSKRREEDKTELIDAWLKGEVSSDDDLATRAVYQDIAFRALENHNGRQEPVFFVQLPQAPKPRKQVERLLAPIDPIITNNEAQVDSARFLRYYQENHGVPLMRVDLGKQEVALGFNGAVTKNSEPPPDAVSVNKALQHLEEYIGTVEWGQSPDFRHAKTSMFEALLYILSAPFAHEHMKIKRRMYGVLESRGPKFLYIFGPAQNGKSTFVRFALKLLTGQNVLPFSGNEFTKSKVIGPSLLGTAYPLIFDDVDPYKKDKSFENVLKSYWEVWWREEYVSPQVILTSNAASLREWAKSRVKRVDFDVHFASSEMNIERLAKIFSVDNQIFKWFSYLYMQRLSISQSLNDDELQLGRLVMKQLYQFAQRPLPDFFPEKPLEQLYDPGRRAWLDLIRGLRKAKVVEERGRALVTFKEDMQSREILEYAGHLPQTVKHVRKGSTLVIESPIEFKTWLDGDTPRSRNWLTGWFKK